ncbi:hypothetical protein ZPAH1_orf00088 [Aeromonas phage ZPAH1]|nr:hypothetical protein ZPAH1_orf00088 [Aeromonas phage ZPAH1]
MRLTNILPDSGVFVAVWVDNTGCVQSENWKIKEKGSIEYWESGWYPVDLDNEFYSGLEIKFVVAE